MNPIYMGELRAIYTALDFARKLWDASNDISIEIKIFDLNGEPLGEVKFGDAGEYAFIPTNEEPSEEKV